MKNCVYKTRNLIISLKEKIVSLKKIFLEIEKKVNTSLEFLNNFGTNLIEKPSLLNTLAKSEKDLHLFQNDEKQYNWLAFQRLNKSLLGLKGKGIDLHLDNLKKCENEESNAISKLLADIKFSIGHHVIEGNCNKSMLMLNSNGVIVDFKALKNIIHNIENSEVKELENTVNSLSKIDFRVQEIL